RLLERHRRNIERVHVHAVLREPDAVASFAVGHRQHTGLPRQPRRLASEKRVRLLAEAKGLACIPFIPIFGGIHVAHAPLYAPAARARNSLEQSPGSRWLDSRDAGRATEEICGEARVEAMTAQRVRKAAAISKIGRIRSNHRKILGALKQSPLDPRQY